MNLDVQFRHSPNESASPSPNHLDKVRINLDKVQINLDVHIDLDVQIEQSPNSSGQSPNHLDKVRIDQPT